MSAVEDFGDAQSLDIVGAECIAFVGDNQTHGVVSDVAREYFPNVVVRDGDPSDALAFLSEAPAPKVLIVDLGDDDQAMSTMLSFTTAFPEDTRLIGIGELNDIELYRELTNAGVTDYLVKPVSERALAAAFKKTEEPPDPGTSAGREKKDTKNIVVLGTRGGVGSSTLAVNLSWLFAEVYKKKTALVDLDLEFGTVALSLDLEPSRGLREALENPNRIDSLFIASATSKLTNNLSVMATEEALSGDITCESEAIEILFETIARGNDCIVVDLPRPAFAMRYPTLQAANHIVLVCELSLAGLRDTIRLLGNVEESAKGKPITVVANHSGGAQQAMRLPDFQSALGRKVDLVIPDDPKAFNEAANNGKPVVHCAVRSKAAKGFQDLAEKIVGKPPVKSKKGSGAKISLAGFGKRSKK